ncbi:MAG: NTP transferase domain-containing protein [Ignavibacteriales bacterium]|jgi:NDP-sugar pyrophosphorylase family protein|nr:NTP transferase domain-containing protein [Ignavibacteriales bacterium]
MNLAIIGAGESSRLKAEGLKVSKHMIKINGEYLIERIIRIARENGLEKVFCIINSHEPKLREYLLTNNFGIPINLIIKDTESSMHSLFELSSYLTKEPFVLATTDSVFLENEFTDFINYCISNQDADGTLAVTQFIDDEKPLCVEIDRQNNITMFSNSKDGFRWATGGIYYFNPRIFDQMQKALNSQTVRLRNFLRLLINSGYKLKAFPFSKIVDVDHLNDIKTAEDFLSNQYIKTKEKN